MDMELFSLLVSVVPLFLSNALNDEKYILIMRGNYLVTGSQTMEICVHVNYVVIES